MIQDALTTKDGIKAERCIGCGQQVRTPDGEPTVAIRISDVEELACLLVDWVNEPAIWGETVTRLEQAVGLTVPQMKARERQRRPAIHASRLDV